VSVERGHDPRSYTLLAFGGGGPLHARAVAAELGMKNVLVPPYPGILCAAGLLMSRLTETFVRTINRLLDDRGMASLRQGVAAMVDSAQQWFECEGVPVGRRGIEASIDLAYQGQSFELSIPLPLDASGAIAGDTTVEILRARFGAAHEQAYGYSSAKDPVVIVNGRLRATADKDRPNLTPREAAAARGAPGGRTRPIWFDRDAPQPAIVFDRGVLTRGIRIAGPAVIDQFDSTTLVFPGDRLIVDDNLNLIIEIGP
jgi:N-methylhydantoinase A